MAVIGSIDVPSKDRLSLLRRLDRTHRWNSLRDQRYCTGCHSVFDGRDVEIVGGTRAFGPLRLLCPSPRCRATPAAWQRAINGSPVGDDVEANAVVLTHQGYACTLRREKRENGNSTLGSRAGGSEWIGLRQVGLGLLSQMAVSLQQGRVIFRQLRSRGGRAFPVERAHKAG